ncbi:MAG: transglycosylase SLT domain-containing protein, partial [Alistipes sp.]|nr:transglycosylase SLT domain-containing protein [Alistipes sp.]
MLNLNFKKTLLTLAFLTLFTTFYGFESREAETEFDEMAAVTAAEQIEPISATLLEDDYTISVYDNIIRRISNEEGNDWRLMSAIAYHESRFIPDVVSKQGAKGLMQIMPVVARQFNVPQEQVLDPETNVRLANMLLNRIESTLRLPSTISEKDRMSIILASYNGGIGHVSDARRLARTFGENPNSWDVVSRYLALKSEPAYYEHEVV